jgi:hypothetical protein
MQRRLTPGVNEHVGGRKARDGSNQRQDEFASRWKLLGLPSELSIAPHAQRILGPQA